MTSIGDGAILSLKGDGGPPRAATLAARRGQRKWAPSPILLHAAGAWSPWLAVKGDPL